MVISLAVDAEFSISKDVDFPPMTREEAITMIAHLIAGEDLAWPSKDSTVYLDDDMANNFPPGIWKQAAERWDSMSLTEQSEYNEMTITSLNDFAKSGMAKWQKRQEFKRSFSPFDLLWFGIAAFTAFKVGSNLAKESKELKS